ncbi:MAG: HD domain-containing protein [Bacteroidaceae bacterium]|nr:HD domain-containing protein [Bacteroidaceae bacterium]
MQSAKIINDPVFGFIRVPRGLMLDIVRHPAFYRLSRIKQLGGANIVYPGAQHTRFQHSLGAFHLMGKAIQSLQLKGHFIFDSEAEAVQAAILLHDIGHGPFSHVLENTLIRGVSHEDISLMVMEQMNEEFRGQLSLAIKIFKDEYPKRFLHQLISSQLDMDRLDYLKRDAFFTGVNEANIGSSRIIDMLDMVDDQLVVDKKGIYSIENYLVSRRLMYWQVYLHKTSVAAEHVMINALLRAKQLMRVDNGQLTVDSYHPGSSQSGSQLSTVNSQLSTLNCQLSTLNCQLSPALRFFLYNDIDRKEFVRNPDCLRHYLNLDDNDIWSAMKMWCDHPDPILSLLSRDFINRNIFKIEISDQPVSDEHKQEKLQELSQRYGTSLDDANYLMANIEVGKDMYSLDDDQIEIRFNDGTTHNLTEASDMLSPSLASKKVRKHYFCYQR